MSRILVVIALTAAVAGCRKADRAERCRQFVDRAWFLLESEPITPEGRKPVQSLCMSTQRPSEVKLIDCVFETSDQAGVRSCWKALIADAEWEARMLDKMFDKEVPRTSAPE